jgi:hypothetical protein
MKTEKAGTAEANKESARPRTVTVEGLEVAPNKKQHLKIGEQYTVTPETAEQLIKTKQAKKIK